MELQVGPFQVPYSLSLLPREALPWSPNHPVRAWSLALRSWAQSCMWSRYSQTRASSFLHSPMALCAEATAVIFLKHSVMSDVHVYPEGATPTISFFVEAGMQLHAWSEVI